LQWDSVTWSYLNGNDNGGTSLGSGGLWGTIGGVCNWNWGVSSQTKERPPWTSRRMLNACVEPPPSCAPVTSSQPDFECTAGSFVSGWGTCPDGIPAGYYPDLTNKSSYCKCTGTAAPSRRETCLHGLQWDTVQWAYLTGDDNGGTTLGSGGYWGTIGGVCNWDYGVSDQTRNRPPWTIRRRLEGCEETPTAAPSVAPSVPTPVPGVNFCIEGTFVNGFGTCPYGIPAGYYPDLTNKDSYCKCTGTKAPSRRETCPNGLQWDTVQWAYIDGNDPTGNALGSGGLWGTIGGVCNWDYGVSNQTTDRPPWSLGARKLLRKSARK